MHHSHVTEVGCHMHGSNQNIIEVMISQMSCDHVQWFQWLQLVIHNRYVDNPNLVSYVLEQPEMLRNRDYKHSNVVHQSSVRPLYLVMWSRYKVLIGRRKRFNYIECNIVIQGVWRLRVVTCFNHPTVVEQHGLMAPVIIDREIDWREEMKHFLLESNPNQTQ